MSLSIDQVKHIAKLARLSLSDLEIEKYSKDLNQILAYVEQLQELDTQGVEPMLGAVQNQKALREDIVIYSGLQEKMLANAPDSEDTAIKVPQMS
jgi:aspartyl-tRNA(Asn)/glutamyl-tRNA(Gln) amidotransferase subunit C